MNHQPTVEYEYQVGGSLGVDAPSYVERQADHQLYAALKAREFCYVLNCRQMGKSSLRVRTMHRLKAEGVRCIAIDMTRIGGEHLSPQQWYEQVVSELWRGAGLPGRVNLKRWREENKDLAFLQLLNQFVEEILFASFPEQPIVIFIDEIDSTLSLPFSINDFFAWIRACYNYRVDHSAYRQLTFCLLGVTTPSDLIRDKIRTPFNIGRAIGLEGFRYEEAQNLAQGLADRVTDPEAALREILEWTGGQPFLTQKVCQLIADQLEIESAALLSKQAIPNFVQQVIQEQLINSWESQDEPEHLRTIRDRLLRNEKLASRLLGLYQQILQQGSTTANDSEGQMELRLSGLVVKRGTVLQVYNPIYAAVFNQTWLERTLDQLRPYAAAFNAWVASKGLDESRLLRGQALEEALQWATGKNLGQQDAEFLRASQAVENRETKQANEILAAANRKAKRRLRLSGLQLGVTVLIAGTLTFLASHSAYVARTITRIDRASGRALEQFQVDQTQAVLSGVQSVYELKRLSQNQAKYPTFAPILALQTMITQARQLVLPTSGQTYMQFTPQGDRLVSLNLGSMRLFDGQGNALLERSIEWNSPSEGEISPDGQYLVVPNEDCYTRLWNLQTNELTVFKGHEGSVNTAQFSPNGTHILTIEMGFDEQTRQRVCFKPNFSGSFASRGIIKFRIWDLQGNLLTTFENDLRPGNPQIKFSPNGQLILITNSDSVEVWNLQGTRITSINMKLGDTVSYEPTGATFSPDGTQIVTGGKDGIVRFWDLSGNPVRSFQAHQTAVSAIQFNDSAQLATASVDGMVRVWDTQYRQISEFQGGRDPVVSLQFSPNGQRLAALYTGNQTTLKVWDVQGPQLGSLTNLSLSHNYSQPLQFDADGQRLVVRGNQTSTILNLQEDQLTTIPPQQGQVQLIKFSVKGDRLITLTEDGTVQIWDMQGNQIANMKGEQPITQVELGAGDRIVTSSNWGQITLWDLQGQQIATLSGSWGSEWKQPLSLDGRFIATLGAANELQVWDTSGQLLATSPPISGAVNSVAFSPKGDAIATAGEYGRVQIWNFEGKAFQGEAQVSFQPHSHPTWVNMVNFTPDGNQLITITPDLPDSVQIWNLQGQLIKKLNTRSLLQTSTNVFSNIITAYPNNGKFISFTWQAAWLWDWQGKVITQFEGENNWFTSTSMNQQGDRIATLGSDDTVRVWDSRGNQIAEFTGYAMALSPDGKQIAIVSPADNALRLFQINDLDGLLQRSCNWLRPYITVDRRYLLGGQTLCNDQTHTKGN